MTYTDLPNIDSFKNIILQNHFHFYHHQSHQKSCEVLGSFQAGNLLLAINTFLEVTDSLRSIFVKISANHSLSVILQLKKSCFLGKTRQFSSQLNHTVIFFFQGNYLNSICRGNALCIYFHFITQDIKITCIQGLSLIQLVMYIAS